MATNLTQIPVRLAVTGEGEINYYFENVQLTFQVALNRVLTSIIVSVNGIDFNGLMIKLVIVCLMN